MGQSGFTEQSSVFPYGASEVFTIRPCCGSASEQGWGGAPGPYGCSGCAPLCLITAITCLAHMWFHTNSLTDSHDTGRGRALGSNEMTLEINCCPMAHFFKFLTKVWILFNLRLQIWTVLARKHTETAQSLESAVIQTSEPETVEPELLTMLWCRSHPPAVLLIPDGHEERAYCNSPGSTGC